MTKEKKPRKSAKPKVQKPPKLDGKHDPIPGREPSDALLAALLSVEMMDRPIKK